MTIRYCCPIKTGIGRDKNVSGECNVVVTVGECVLGCFRLAD